jgi:hypothetical protein
MAERAETEAARVRLFRAIAAAAAQGAGIAQAHRIGEQVGLSREQTDTFCADLQAAGLLQPTPAHRFVSVTPRGWLWWQRLPQETPAAARVGLGPPQGRGRGA